MTKLDTRTRCPQRYAHLRPVTALDDLECRDFHDHSNPLYCLVTDAAPHFQADREWQDELRRIAALEHAEQAAEIRAQRIHDVDRKQIERYAQEIARAVRAARYLAVIAE